MENHAGMDQFHDEVYPAELEEIGKRRMHLGLPEPPEKTRSVADLELVGLALSGGSIRSAT